MAHSKKIAVAPKMIYQAMTMMTAKNSYVEETWSGVSTSPEIYFKNKHNCTALVIFTQVLGWRDRKFSTSFVEAEKELKRTVETMKSAILIGPTSLNNLCHTDCDYYRCVVFDVTLTSVSCFRLVPI